MSYYDLSGKTVIVTGAETGIGRAIALRALEDGASVTGAGINREGLKRRGFSPESLVALKRAYKTIYRSGLKREQMVERLREMAAEEPAVALLAEFVAVEGRGLIR